MSGPGTIGQLAASNRLDGSRTVSFRSIAVDDSETSAQPCGAEPCAAGLDLDHGLLVTMVRN